LSIPVVWNTGGYENADTIRDCRGLVDVFLTDFKYGTAETAEKYSAAPDYVTAATDALIAMVEVAGKPRWQGDRLTGGVILRHLVLPGGRRDSEAALTTVARTIDPDVVILSLMRQYTPDFAPVEFPTLRRRVTTFEYEYVRDAAIRLGFGGYSQDADSATAAYTPEF
jgi:putative pyruvate formate lyase activating enzyme